MDDVVAEATSAPRLTLSLLAVFAAAALGLAGFGVFGVVAYTVKARVREIGIRMALGARASDVQQLIVRQVMRSTAAGILTGLVAAVVLMRMMAAMFYEVSANDPLIIGAVTVLLAISSAVAGWLPALRASRIDPVLVLQDQ
jgi:ABC-type antimicrobial peptide transport system permease subunit